MYVNMHPYKPSNTSDSSRKHGTDDMDMHVNYHEEIYNLVSAFSLKK